MNVLRLSSVLMLCILAHTYCEEIRYFSSFKWKSQELGEESSVRNYVSLGNDPADKLSDAFTICSSYLIEFVQGPTHLFQLYKEDGSHWFSAHIFSYVRDYKKMSDKIKFTYENPQTNSIQVEYIEGIDGIGIPTAPHSWYQICIGLDTISGLLRIVVNGRKVVDVEKQYLKNTRNWIPSSILGKLVGKKSKKYH